MGSRGNKGGRRISEKEGRGYIHGIWDRWNREEEEERVYISEYIRRACRDPVA